jgi:putative intracellular protease/amidase
MALLETTARPDEIDASTYDAIYFTGGHGVMFDFTDDAGLHRLTREIVEAGGIVSSVCHGYCALLNATLYDGNYLIDGRKITGFSWNEEVLVRVDTLVPYNAEELAVERGADYEKSLVPFKSYVGTDGTLITGQNPGSAKAIAKAVATALA